MNKSTVIVAAFNDSFKPLVPYTPEKKIITRPDGSKHIRRASTGNLRYNATKIERVSDNHYRISMDQGTAPYMPFTNEPWTVSRWRGSKNPNEGWFDRAVKIYANELAHNLGGTIK